MEIHELGSSCLCAELFWLACSTRFVWVMNSSGMVSYDYLYFQLWYNIIESLFKQLIRVFDKKFCLADFQLKTNILSGCTYLERRKFSREENS